MDGFVPIAAGAVSREVTADVIAYVDTHAPNDIVFFKAIGLWQVCAGARISTCLLLARLILCPDEECDEEGGDAEADEAWRVFAELASRPDCMLNGPPEIVVALDTVINAKKFPTQDAAIDAWWNVLHVLRSAHRDPSLWPVTESCPYKQRCENMFAWVQGSVASRHRATHS